MDETPDFYFFDTREECCKAFFVFESCPTDEDLSVTKFYPDWRNRNCGRKSSFQPWELDELYDTLDECCEATYPSTKEKCCSTQGLGGCEDKAADLVYLPDWTSEKCYGKSSGLVASHEVSFSKDSKRSCCKGWFSWDEKACCQRSGGC